MRVLFDNDVILDVILDREPFAEVASALWERHNAGEIDGLVAAITLVNTFYVARKTIGAQAAREAVAKIVATFEVCAVDEATLRAAIASPIADYEDAVQHECALAAGADALITRNTADFQNATLPILSPLELERRLTNS